ncbi:hypothetical protein EI427_04865 [Flammeovirga pectinis]|uniref:Potassium channel domain-containing protein n=1 Tax=Flammeovirga pectinis TaxID=2494373 RepID=A0A3Q9FK56_9BACT|nr:ion channel [Flammeovirga pectinis]AZQ61583.1 hypothetical protein EI427_04865 [Flammeovirga pectinis]
MIVINTKIRDFLEESRYVILLIAYFLVLWVPIIFQSFNISDELSDISLVVLMFAILNFIRKAKFYNKITLVITFFIITGRSASVGTESDSVNIANWIAMLIYFSIFLTILLKQVWSSKSVNMNTILGAIAGYIQIGVIEFILFKICDAYFDGKAFNTTVSIADIIYFSFVTLTTVGYGDITPVVDEARAFSVIFAMVGQFYMAILMALLVGKYQQEHSKQ